MPDKHISIEEALKRLDEQKREHDAMIEASRLREAKENAWMNNPNPKDYTLEEWIELWHEVHTDNPDITA